MLEWIQVCFQWAFCPNAEAGPQGRAFAGQGAGAVSMSLSQFLRSPCDAMAMLRSKASAGEIMARPCVGLRLIDHVPDISLHTRVVSCRCLALRMQSLRIDAIFPKELYLAHHLASFAMPGSGCIGSWHSGVFAPSSLFSSRPSFSHMQSIACDP